MTVGGPEPIKSVDRSKKDFQLLQKLDVLTGAMHQKPETMKVKQRVSTILIIIFSHISRISSIIRIESDTLKTLKRDVFY